MRMWCLESQKMTPCQEDVSDAAGRSCNKRTANLLLLLVNLMREVTVAW